MKGSNMQTKISPNYNSTAFKGANLIKIKKSAFPNPENLRECSQLFSKNINSVSGDKSGIISVIIAMFKPQTHKTYIFPDNNAYFMTKNSLKKNNIPYSVEWFSQRAKLPIISPQNSDYHSFYILTGEYKDKGIKLTKKVLTNIRKYTKEAGKIFPLPENIEGKTFREIMNEYLPLRKVYSTSKASVEIEKGLGEIISTTPVNTIEIESLKDINKIARDLLQK